MLPFHGTNKKKAGINHGLAAGANRKNARVRIFVKIFYATPTVLLFRQLFYFSTLFDMAPQKRLVLNYHVSIN